MKNYPHSVKILSVGAVIVRWDKTQQKFLYLLLRAHNFWDFPKGQTEANEKPIETALREICEETTLTELYFPWGYPYYETTPYFKGRKVARYYLAETNILEISLPINPELGRPEHNAWRWVTREESLTMVTPRVQNVVIWADEFLTKDPRYIQSA